jgi:hypothetical protein
MMEFTIAEKSDEASENHPHNTPELKKHHDWGSLKV